MDGRVLYGMSIVCISLILRIKIWENIEILEDIRQKSGKKYRSHRMLKKTLVNDKISNNTYSKVVLLKKNNTCMITFMTCNNNM